MSKLPEVTVTRLGEIIAEELGSKTQLKNLTWLLGLGIAEGCKEDPVQRQFIHMLLLERVSRLLDGAMKELDMLKKLELIRLSQETNNCIRELFSE